MITFSGNPTVNDSVTFGNIQFFQPTGASGNVSVRTKIREALANGIYTTIRKSNGYFFDIGEVNVNVMVNNNGRKKFPSVDIIWVKERYTNNFQGGNSLGGYNKFATVMIEGHLIEENCSEDPASITLMKEMFVADMEKYFGTNFFLPDPVEGRADTAFNTMIIFNTDFGIDVTRPRGGVEVQLEISYRILLTDPTQTF